MCYSKTIVIFPNDIIKIVAEIIQLKVFHFIHHLKMKKSEADDKNTFRIKEKLFPFGQASSGLSNFAIYVHIYKSR